MKFEKPVSPSLYDDKYYLEYCSGFKEFKKSFGKKYDFRTQKIIKRIPGFSKDAKILDMGCGRGEMILWFAQKGAKAFGIDYSKDAITFAKKAVKNYPPKIANRVSFKEMNAKDLAYPNKYFDGIISLTVYEHLFYHERIKLLKEAKRVLKDDGFILIHTEPNKYFNNYTQRFWCYPVSTFLIKINKLFTGRSYPNLFKITKEVLKEQHVRHVGEPTYFSLKQEYTKVKLKGSIISPNYIWNKPLLSWKDRLYNLIVFLDPLSRYFPLNVIFGQDFWVLLKK